MVLLREVFLIFSVSMVVQDTYVALFSTELGFKALLVHELLDFGLSFDLRLHFLLDPELILKLLMTKSTFCITLIFHVQNNLVI